MADKPREVQFQSLLPSVSNLLDDVLLLLILQERLNAKMHEDNVPVLKESIDWLLAYFIGEASKTLPQTLALDKERMEQRKQHGSN